MMCRVRTDVSQLQSNISAFQSVTCWQARQHLSSSKLFSKIVSGWNITQISFLTFSGCLSRWFLVRWLWSGQRWGWAEPPVQKWMIWLSEWLLCLWESPWSQSADTKHCILGNRGKERKKIIVNDLLELPLFVAGLGIKNIENKVTKNVLDIVVEGETLSWCSWYFVLQKPHRNWRPNPKLS